MEDINEEILGEFRRKFTLIIEQGKAFCYSDRWFVELLDRFELAGGTRSELDRIEEEVIREHYMKNRGSVKADYSRLLVASGNGNGNGKNKCK